VGGVQGHLDLAISNEALHADGLQVLCDQACTTTSKRMVGHTTDTKKAVSGTGI